MESGQTDVEDLHRSDDEEMTQLCVRTTRASLRTFKRLADRQGKTLTQWVLDLCWEEVTRDVEELRKSIDEAEAKAQREREAELAEVERETARRKQQPANSRKSKVRQTVTT